MQKLKVGIVSSYPPPGDKHYGYFSRAISWYTGNLISSLKGKDIKIEIFTNKLERLENHYELGDNISIFLCWQRGSFVYPLQIFARIFKNMPTLVHIQHEFFLYGTNIISAVVFPILLLLTKLISIHTVVTLHGVVPLSKVDKSFIEGNQSKLPIFIVKSGFFILTKMIALFATTIIVHEHLLQRVLNEDYGCPLKKIKVIPLGIEERNDRIGIQEAKKILNFNGKKVILFFGYITGYKGIELLIEAFGLLIKNHPDYLLVIAGGEHPRLKDKASYKDYYLNLQTAARQISSEQILFTGFVPEDKISVYFSAADLVIFPYTVCMSSSGPLTFAITYNRPFLVSDSFEEIVELKEIIFKNKLRELAKKVEQFFSDDDFRKKSLDYCERLRKERMWTNVGAKTHELYQYVIRDR